MPRPKRDEQFETGEICIVHAVQRCVRRAFLAGVDAQTGKDYSFRKEWIRRRMEALASVFGIDVLSYAVMSNHLHVILRNRPDVVASWTDAEVAIRWLRVFPGRRMEEHLAEPTEHEVKVLTGNADRIAEIRQRMSDISWFMRSLAEPISRLANKQDECTGRFWEGRFKAQRIVDEAGLLACSMYVELNPVRAAIESDPEKAMHTSAFDRIQGSQGKRINSAAFDLKPIPTEEAARRIRETPVEELREQQRAKKRNPTGKRIRRDAWLAPLTLSPSKLAADAEVNRDGLRASDKGFLHVSIRDYLRLLRWTAKQSVDGIAANVPDSLASTLTQLGIDASMWRDLVWQWQRYFGKSICVGSPESMRKDAQRFGKHHHRGQASASACFA
ncbi:hypothetical protein SAMN06265222_107284 [Neorhodopirellula lusitana]|uniref:Transposase IS200-like domain-containing protein n=1 Tax=Neorhodopirellula lusitana TaxID=445327 RepID=A0ABY1QAP4_9BACT|nr:transposase [Neorhodopirellula lusitana]SMP62288.1 hypothetical protein SAMN06265222_107284 [Neorhodopirellula lusitana]